MKKGSSEELEYFLLKSSFRLIKKYGGGDEGLGLQGGFGMLSRNIEKHGSQRGRAYMYMVSERRWLGTF